MKKTLTLIIMSMVMSWVACAQAQTNNTDNKMINSTEITTEHVLWDKTPIKFNVPTGQERMITFPDAITLTNTDPSLTREKVSLIADAGTLYVRAKETFSPVRVQVKLMTEGQIILLDLSSTEGGDDTPLDVVLNAGDAVNVKRPAAQTLEEEEQTGGAAVPPAVALPTVPAPTPISLLRYAIQQLYAPQRLLTEPANVARTPMYTTKDIHLFYGDNTSAFPISSWRGGDLYVTAVIIKNNLPRSLTLDPRKIFGNWQAITFYPTNVLKARGQARDQTTAFLISDEPFGQALQSRGETR